MKLNSIQKGCHAAKIEDPRLLEHLEGRMPPEADTVGILRLTVNFRRCDEGFFEPVARPESLGIVNRKAAGTDARDGGINIFTQSWQSQEERESGSGSQEGGVDLYWEGTLRPGEPYHPVRSRICPLPDMVVETARAGNFCVLRLADGTLCFLLWEYDTRTYTLLGSSAQLPQCTVTRTEPIVYRAPVPPVAFRSAVADMRGGVPAEVTTRVAATYNNAWKEALHTLAVQRRYVQPVSVRVALRLWDGTLLAVSDPLEVEGPAHGYQGTARVMLPLVKGSKGYIGTSSGAISVESYGLKINIGAAASSVWGNVVRTVDVYVSSEQDVRRSSSVSVTYNEGSDSIALTPDCRSAADLEALLSGQSMQRSLSTTPDAPGEYVLDRPGEDVAQEVLTTLTPAVRRADHIFAHGGFLHMAQGERVTTMRRNNPFVEASQSETGGNVRAMSAMPAGGGAYTRQYLYLFTDSGTMALTHDSTGRHCTCRQVAPSAAAEARSVASAPDCVYFMTPAGELVRLRDARARVVIKGLPGESELCYDRLRDELWISRAPEFGGYALVSHPESGHSYWHTLGGGEWIVRDGDCGPVQIGLAGNMQRMCAEAPRDSEESLPAFLMTNFKPERRHGRCTLRLRAFSRDGSLHAEVWYRALPAVALRRVAAVTLKGAMALQRTVAYRLPTPLIGNVDSAETCALVAARGASLHSLE